MDTENYLESMVNQLSSSGIFPRTYNIADFQKDSAQNDCQTCPANFEDPIMFVSVFDDIDWTKKGNCNECFSNSEKVKTQEGFRLDTGLFSVQEKKRICLDGTITNLNDGGTVLQMLW